MSRQTTDPAEAVEEAFLNRVHKAESMEEVVWLESLWTAIEEEDWSNVPYRSWVLEQVCRPSQNIGGLLQLIDRYYGDEIESKKEDNRDG